MNKIMKDRIKGMYYVVGKTQFNYCKNCHTLYELYTIIKYTYKEKYDQCIPISWENIKQMKCNYVIQNFPSLYNERFRCLTGMNQVYGIKN